MVVLIDTNIIIDFLTTREPYYQAASQVMEKCSNGQLDGCVAFHTIPNIWYILRKVPEKQRRTWIENICDCLKVVGASHERVIQAIKMSSFKDFEDCLQDRCAEEAKADFIVTRNTADFAESKIPAIEPEEFLHKIC